MNKKKNKKKVKILLFLIYFDTCLAIDKTCYFMSPSTNEQRATVATEKKTNAKDTVTALQQPINFKTNATGD